MCCPRALGPFALVTRGCQGLTGCCGRRLWRPRRFCASALGLFGLLDAESAAAAAARCRQACFHVLRLLRWLITLRDLNQSFGSSIECAPSRKLVLDLRFDRVTVSQPSSSPSTATSAAATTAVSFWTRRLSRCGRSDLDGSAEAWTVRVEGGAGVACVFTLCFDFPLPLETLLFPGFPRLPLLPSSDADPRFQLMLGRARFRPATLMKVPMECSAYKMTPAAKPRIQLSRGKDAAVVLFLFFLFSAQAFKRVRSRAPPTSSAEKIASRTRRPPRRPYSESGGDGAASSSFAAVPLRTASRAARNFMVARISLRVCSPIL
eukprot:scaffold8365_cov267-Pinguiococcus_pyrenoidosus.AAC.3